MLVLTKNLRTNKNYLREINQIFVKKQEQKLSSALRIQKMLVKISEQKIFVRLKNLRPNKNNLRKNKNNLRPNKYNFREKTRTKNFRINVRQFCSLRRP